MTAVDTRNAVWVSTPEKFSKIVLGKTRNFSRKFRGVSAPALDKNPAVTVIISARTAFSGFKVRIPSLAGGHGRSSVVSSPRKDQD